MADKEAGELMLYLHFYSFKQQWHSAHLAMLYKYNSNKSTTTTVQDNNFSQMITINTIHVRLRDLRVIP